MINYFTKTIVSKKNCYSRLVLNCKWFQKNSTDCDLEKLNFSIFGADINSFGRRYEKREVIFLSVVLNCTLVWMPKLKFKS